MTYNFMHEEAVHLRDKVLKELGQSKTPLTAVQIAIRVDSTGAKVSSALRLLVQEHRVRKLPGKTKTAFLMYEAT